MDEEISFAVLFLGTLLLLYAQASFLFFPVWIVAWLVIQVNFLGKAGSHESQQA